MNYAEKNEPKPKSFWETLPGVITAVAALLTAISGCIATVIFSWPKPNVLFPATPTPIMITQLPTFTSTISPSEQPPPLNDIPFIYANDFGSGITIHKIRAQIAGTNVEFQFDYSSDHDKSMSFFNPPAGDIISIQQVFLSGTNSVLFSVSVSALKKVSDITVCFYLPSQNQQDCIFLDLKEIKNILP